MMMRFWSALIGAATVGTSTVFAQSKGWLHEERGKFFLNLPADLNWSEYYPLRTEWKKLRLLEDDLKEGSRSVTVDMKDYTYASHNGRTSNSHNLKEMDWGVAADCRYGSRYQSSYSLNLVGTPFKLQSNQPAESPGGFSGHGSASCSQNQQVCRGKCGGHCGYCGFGHAGVTETVTLVVMDQGMFDKPFITTTTTTETTTTATTVTATTVTATITTASTTTETTTTSMVCGAGERRNQNSNTCSACPFGTWRPDLEHSLTECIPHSKCGKDQFVLVEPTATSNVHCRSAGECEDDEWESEPPVDAQSDRVCIPLTQCMPGYTYLKTPSRKGRDQECAPCDGTQKSYDGGCERTTTTRTTRTTTTRTRTTKTRTTTSKTTTTESTTTTTTATTATTTTATTEFGNAAVNEIKTDFIDVSIDEIRDEMGTDFTNLPDAIQVIDLHQEGFTLAEIVTAGYSRNDVKDAGFTVEEYEDAKANADATASASTADKAATNEAHTTNVTIVIVVAAVLVLLTVAIATVYANKIRNGYGSGAAGPPQAFENPMYGDSMNPHAPVYAGGGAAGYMDADASANATTSGYMDVNASSSGYMDVAPENAVGNHAGEGSDDEDV